MHAKYKSLRSSDTGMQSPSQTVQAPATYKTADRERAKHAHSNFESMMGVMRVYLEGMGYAVMFLKFPTINARYCSHNNFTIYALAFPSISRRWDRRDDDLRGTEAGFRSLVAYKAP